MPSVKFGRHCPQIIRRIIEVENIKDYILSDLSAEESATEIPKKVPSTEYSIVFASGPDFAVRRKTKVASKVLVFLVSQSQYYFKDEKTEEVKRFSPGEYARFMSDAPECIMLTDENGSSCNWLRSLPRGKAFGERLEEMIKRFDRDEEARLAATRNWLLTKRLSDHGGNSVKKNIKASEPVVKKVISVCMEYEPEETVKEAYTNLALYGWCLSDKIGSLFNSLLKTYTFGNTPRYGQERQTGCSADLLVDAYGLSGLEEIIREYFQVGVSSFPAYVPLFALFHAGGRIDRYGYLCIETLQTANDEKRKFNLRDFKHYLWYQSVYQGYADDINNFVQSWSDSLGMQETIYGKIKEKYPDNLASCEKKLSYKFSQIKQEIDEKKWNGMVKCMELLEYKGRKYSIICPKTAADVVDEAQQQSNCLASYVSKIINGECMVLFCRRTDEPERSLVTIEILANGALGQVKARFNRAPDPEVRDFIDRWYYNTVLSSGLWPQAA